jgi:hypothetical protein
MKYIVTLREVVRYKIEVEADNQEEAEALAEHTFVHAEDTDQYFDGVIDRDAIDVEEIPATEEVK